jgi:uracil-DNA glycosylase
MTPEETLSQIAAEVNKCTRCELHHSRKNGVAGEGPVDAEIIFIGESPGFHENEQGRPFVGASGRYFDELLALCNLKRQSVFLGNVVKCRPPTNRDPQAEELTACNFFLDRQIQVIKPRVIVTLGRFSMAKYFPHAKISEIHGQPMRVRGSLIIPMYNPAAALHLPSLKSTLEADFAKLPELIASAAEAPEYAAEISDETEEPQQLSMF